MLVKHSARIAIVVGVAAALAASFVLAQRYWQADRELAARLASAALVRGTPVECSRLAAEKPLVLLALGQSNAANHGQRAAQRPAVTLFHEGRCMRATDPLPGGTGDGASLWPDLIPLLAQPVLLSLLAVDATTIDDWTRLSSPIRHKLVTHLKAMRDENLQPGLILWHQGEADAMRARSSDDYRKGLRELSSIFNQSGVAAPIVVAYSTVCRSKPDAAIRQAIDAEMAADTRFRRGPDLDTLLGHVMRHDGCHFSAVGLERAAELWRAAVVAAAPSPAR